MSRVVEGQDSAPSAEAAPPMEEKLAILAEEGAIVPPVDVVVHGWGTQEDLVEAVADVGQTWRRAQAQAVSGGGGAARATRRFDSGNEWSSFGARVASGDAYPRLRKFFHYGKSSCNLEQEVWFWDKKNPDAKQNPLKEYTILHVHHHGAVAGLPSATSEPGNLHVVDAVDARHLCRLSDVSMSYQGDNPFIDTYIESSNLPAYKAFPSSEWTCSKCQTANPLSGWVCKGGPRSGSCRERRPKRTCTDWNFNADPNKDVVLAAILSKSVAQGVQKWQRPKGKKWKTTTRGEEGEGAEPRACELSLDELMGLVGAGGTGVSGGAAAAGADQMQAGHVIYREARAVGGGATFGGGGRCPESSPDKFTVLFIGANVKGKEELKLDELEVEKEQERLWAAFKDEKGRTFFEKRGVLFVPDTFADVSDVIRKVGKRRPTVVHFACHGGEQGLHFSRSFLGSSEFAEFLRHHNDELPGSERVRLVIVNACKSGAFAAALTQWVDFAIGHGEEDAVDDEAIVFTEILYQNLGEGKSLRASFTAARTASGTRSYQLFCRRVDPKQWSLVSADNGGGLGAGGVGATVRGNEPQGDMAEVISAELLELKKSMWRDLCSFLHKSGRFGVAARLRDEVKVHSLEDFADLVEADFAAFVPFEGRRLVKLVPICREELAQRMSGTMADDGSVLSGTETELVVSDSGMTSDGESDSESVVVAARNLGDREHWKEHLQNLIFEFGDQSNRDTSVPFYMLMLVRFMWDADFSDLESRAEWRAALRDVEQGGFTWAEEDVCECFDRVVKQKGFRHRLLVESSFTTRKCRECIFVVDLLVRSCGKSQPQVAVEWQRRVWDGTASNPDQFFARANKFLHDDIDSICVLGDAIETKSYCAFLHMSKLTAFLLFGFLEMRKRRSEAGGQAAQGLAGFRLFVSSDGRVFSASQQDRPGWENLRGIGEGLRCLARLPREDLGDALVPMAQLAQDGVALKVPLVVDQLTGGDAAVASPLTAEFYRPSAEFLSAPVAASGGSSRPARTAAKCTCRVSKADLAASQVREEAMGRLRWWVESDAAEAPGRMLVCGVGGAGKSTLARMFAARAAAEGLREAVLFLTMSDGNRSDEYLELAKILEGGANVQDLQKMSEEKLRAHVHGLLESEEWEGRWLVVLDDLPDPGDEGASWVARDFPFGSGKTLVTSRSQGWIAEGGAGLWEKLALEGMSEGEACAWVRRRVEAWAGDEAGVLELVRKLGCFPLAIEQAAAFAREYSIETPALYLAEQAKGSSKLREKWEKRRVRGGYPLSFAEVISLTFGRLIEADDDDSVGAIHLLRKMAFLHSDGIPKDLFQDAEWKHVTSLKRHSLVVDCPTLGGVSMHALTQKVVRELLMGDSKATALGGVLETLDAKMSKFRLDRPATYFVGRRYVRHVKAAALHAQDCPARQDTVLATVCHSAGVFLSEISCSFAEALEMHHISVSARSRAYGPDDVDVANTYNNMAAIYEKQGQYVEALELYEKSQAIMIKARGHDYVAVARTYGNMADVYYKQGKNTEAQVLFEKSKEIRIKALGPDHVDVAATCTNIANIYKEQGKYAKALELHEKSKAIFLKTLRPDHVDVAATCTNIANIYKEQGKYAKALELHEKSKAIFLKTLGPDHVDVTKSYDGIATIYTAQGKLVEALEMHEKSLAIKIKALGHNHVKVADSYNGIAIIYKAQGKLMEALELHEKSKEIKIKALGEDHVDVANAKYNMAACLEKQGELVRAGGLFRESAAIYSKVLGAEHEETLDALEWARRCEQGAA